MKQDHSFSYFRVVKFTLLLTALLFTGNYLHAQDISSVHVIEDGQAQIITDFEDQSLWIRHDLWVETDFDTDGNGKPDRMHVAVTRPAQTESADLKLPVIYESSPYYAGIAGSRPFDYFWDVRHELGELAPQRNPAPKIKRKGYRPIISNSQIEAWVPRGFIVVHSSSPGTGLSQGAPTVGGINESLAPKAVIDWLNGRAKGYTTSDGYEEVKAFWSNGIVGMIGTSFNGTLALAAATTAVEDLKAIIPTAPNTSYYHYYRSNGLIRYPGGFLGEDIDVLYDFINSGPVEFRDSNSKTVRDTEMAKGMDRSTGDYNEFWQGRDYINQLDSLRTPVFMSHAFNDWNVMPEHSYRIYNAIKNKVPSMIYYHQGGHGGEPPMELMNKWFSRYLLGFENGVDELPRAWITREGDERLEPTPYEDYPNPDTKPVSFYITPGAPERGELVDTQKTDKGTETLIDNFSFSGSSLAKAEITDHRLIYVTPKLAEPVHISGVPEVTIALASSKPAVNLSVWLVSLPWNEGKNVQLYDNVITRGWASPQNHRSIWESEPLTPGEFVNFTFDMQPDDQVISAGQQIGLMIFSTDRDFTVWPDPGTELTIDLDNTSITLPIVGGSEALNWKE